MKKQPPRKLKKKIKKSPISSAKRVVGRIDKYIKTHKIELSLC